MQSRAEQSEATRVFATHLVVGHLDVEVFVRAHDRHGLLHIEHVFAAGYGDGTQLWCASTATAAAATPTGEKDGKWGKEAATRQQRRAGKGREWAVGSGATGQ